MAQNKKTIPMDYVTKEDLKDQTKTIKEHIDLLISPMKEKQDDVDIVLFGKSRINGVVGRLRSVIINVGVVYAFLIGAIGLLVKLLFFKTI